MKIKLVNEDDPLEVLAELVYQMKKGQYSTRRGNVPMHAHEKPGIWDNDNGSKSGKPCTLCAAWNKANDLLEKTGMND